jgi:hypothetical protein
LRESTCEAWEESILPGENRTITQRFCINHSQRPAIGICVMTRVPICSECSTRYEGVNYSKEGLALLRREREAAPKRRRRLLLVLAWIASPVMLYLVYLSYWIAAEAIINLLHRDY